MHRVRSLGILSASIMAVALIGCGDDGTWGGKTPPPLNAGPGVNALYTPVDNSSGGGGGGGGGAVVGDWFRCRGEGNDPCDLLENPGVGIRADGRFLGLVGSSSNRMDRGTPYCEIDLEKTWKLDGDVLTVTGEDPVTFVVSGDRAMVTETDKTPRTYLRQSLSIGSCDQLPQPGPG